MRGQMANVYHRRAVLSRLLKSELPNDFIILPNPDHPLLIRAPDLLVSKKGMITAIFLPSAAERRSHNILTSRLTLSRLALPPHTRCILIVEARDYSLGEIFSNDFAEIFAWTARSKASEFVGNVNSLGRHRDLPPDVAGDAQTTFSNAMGVMRLAARLADQPFTSAFGETVTDEALDHLDQRKIRSSLSRPTIKRNAHQLGGVPVTELADAEISSLAVQYLINNQTEHLYRLDNGIPYATKEPPGIAVVSQWPLGGRDPEKLIHAAAFGGWAFVLDAARDELPRFAHRLNQRRTT